MNKGLKIFTIVLAAIVIVGGILWYYQQQGILKLFPTDQEKIMKKLLVIDRSKFTPAQGLSTEKFEQQIQALRDQKTKVQNNPNDAQAWFDFGYTLDFLNAHEQAAAVWEVALQLQPLNFVTANNLGNDYQYFLKDYPKAEIYYLKALEIRPDNTTAYQGLIDLYRYNLKDQQDKLEPLMLQAAANDKANEASYYATLVEFFASKNDYDKARSYYTKVSALNQTIANDLKQNYPKL